MTLSAKTKYGLGVGLVTFPIFVMGFLLGMLIILLTMTQSANAATQGKLGKSSTASVRIQLIIHAAEQPQKLWTESRVLSFPSLNMKIKYIEPV